MSELISSVYRNVIVSASDIESMYIESQNNEAKIASKFNILFTTRSGKVFMMDMNIPSYAMAVFKLQTIANQIYHCESLIYQIPETNLVETDALEEEPEEEEIDDIVSEEEEESSIIKEAM